MISSTPRIPFSIRNAGISKTAIVAFLIVIVLPIGTLANAYVVKPYAGALVLTFGSDEVLVHATQQIAAFIPSARFLSVETVGQLESVLRNAVGQVIYVGHGFPNGIQIGKSLIGWDLMRGMISQSPSLVHMFAACFSALAQVPGKVVYGFKGLVDVDEGAMWVTSMYYGLKQQIAKIPQIFQYFYAILVDKVINPGRNLLAFLGPIYCLSPPKNPEKTGVSSDVLIQPECGGGGGGGSTPPPCSNIGGYCIGNVRGIWHVKYSDSYCCYVKYTHPDTYVNYPWIGVDSSTTLTGNNLYAGHVPKSTVDTYDLASIISSGLVGIGVGILLTGIIGFIVGAIIFLAGVAVSYFVNEYVRDQLGAAWEWLQNWWSAWYGFGAEMKIGKFQWMAFGINFGVAYSYPLWYGGIDLGIGGM